MANVFQTRSKAILLGSGLALLAACNEPLDFDLRSLGNGFDTSDAVTQRTADRPRPDSRGIISYPNYQVAIARQGDRIADVAARVGLPAADLARHNGIPETAVLRRDEVIVLPRRVTEPSPATGAITTGPIRPGGVDITSLAGDAIDRAGTQGNDAPDTSRLPETGAEPIRHRVERGETAFSIARLYNVSARSMADWNGLGADMSIREGQLLLIPVAAAPAPGGEDRTAPGEGSPTPEPPSAATALPADNPEPVAAPQSPNLGDDADDGSGLVMPVDGKIIRAYAKGTNDGIDIAADAGSPVRAAAAGTVAAITRDTDQVPIVVLRHADNLLTVYAGVDNLDIKKGDKVTRGQVFARIRAGNPSFLHFETRRGLDSVDPVPLLN